MSNNIGVDTNFYSRVKKNDIISENPAAASSFNPRENYVNKNCSPSLFSDNKSSDDFFDTFESNPIKADKNANKPQWGWRKMVSKTVFPWISKSVDEKNYDDAIHTLNSSIINSGVIAVVSHKGGVGKTTLTSLYANIIADTRKIGKILIIEATPGGTLAQRIAPTNTVNKNLRALQDHINSLTVEGKEISTAEMFSYLIHNKNRVSALVWDPNPTHPRLTGGELKNIIDRFSKEFDVILVDCEPQVDSDLAQTAVNMADSIIAVGDNTASGIKGLVSYLGWLNHVHPEKNNVINVVINYHTHNPYFDVDAALLGLKKRGFDKILFVPVEDHLSKDNVIDVYDFSKRSRVTFTRHAAHIFEDLTSRTPGYVKAVNQ